MAITVELFDGSRIEFPDNTPTDVIERVARQKTRELQGIRPESGGGAALRAGIQSLLGAGAAFAGRTGLMDVEEAQRAYEARKQRAEEIFQPSPEGWGAPINKILELAGSSAPYMALPVVAGAATLAAPVTGAAATALGLGAAGLTSAAQFTGTNLVRQMEEGKQLRETELGSAVGAAIPQALLDTVAMRMIPGVGRIFGSAGVKVTKENAEAIAKQALGKTVQDYAVSTGRAMTVEGVTEAAQQSLERLQAGLSISDPEARAEYFDAFIGGAVLGGVISPAGRFMERGSEQRQARRIIEDEASRVAQEQRAAEEAQKQTPEYLFDLEARYKEASAQKTALETAAKNPGKKAKPKEKEAYAEAKKQLDEFKRTSGFNALEAEYKTRKQEIDVLAQQRNQAAELAAAQTVPQETQTLPFYESPQGTLPGMEAVEPPAAPVVEEAEAPEDERARLEKDVRNLTALVEQQRVQMAEAQSIEESVNFAKQVQKTKAELAAAEAAYAKLPEVPQVAVLEKEAAKLEKQLAVAREEGDEVKVERYGNKLLAVQQKLAAARPDEGLFAPEVIAAEQQRRDAAEQDRIALGEAMGAGREAAGYERQQAEIEQQTAREEAAQAEAQRAEADARMREAPQLEMFAPPREQVTRTTEAPKMTAQVQSLQNQLAALQKRSAEVADDPARAADVNKQIAAVQTRLDALTPEVTETQRVSVPPQEGTPVKAIPPTLPKQIDALAARVVASPRVDEETKEVVRQIQADVPAFLKAVTAQAARSVPEMRQRAETAMTKGPSKVVPAAPAETFTPQQTAAWLYRTLNTGRADPADTARVQSVLQQMDAAKRGSEEAVTQYAGRALTGEEKQVLRGTSMEGRIGTLTREPTETVRRATQAEIPGVEPKPTPAPTPAPAVETRATREAADAAARKEEQARLERGEASAVQVFFEQNKPDIMADTNYTALVERSYDSNLPAAERMKAATEADKYMQAKAARIERRKTARSAAAQLHEKNLNAAKVALSKLETKVANAKNPEAVNAQIAAKRLVIDKHQRLLNTALTGTKIERFTRGDLNELRQRVHAEVRSPTQERAEAAAEVAQTREPGERLGVTEGTQARAIGPVTRAEVMAPKTMRTGSEESREGATTTPPNMRLREARGQKQRDIAITKGEMAEAEQTAAPIREERKTKAAQAKKRAEAAQAEAKAKEEAAVAKLKAARKKAPGRKRAAAISEMEELEAFGLDEISLSRGPTADPSSVASLRAELGKVFPDLGRVQMYESVEALIAANPQYKGRIPADARGFVDSAGNKAFLIAENIDKGRALSVLLHEVGAHVGLKSTLGDAQYNALVNAVKSWEKRTDNSTEAKVARAARSKVEAAETKAGQVNDELLAYAIEEAVNAGVKPTETKGVLGRWLSQIAALFRKALEKFGLPPKALDAQGIVDMAFGAAKMELQQGAEVEARAETAAEAPGEILFSRNLSNAARVANEIVGRQKSWSQRLRDNYLGMGFRAQYIDKFAPVEAALKKSLGAVSTKAIQAMYYLRMYDQRMHFTSQAIIEGAPQRIEKLRKDGTREFIIESKPGANISQIVDILKRKDVVKAAGSPDAANKLFTLYLAKLRADRVGYGKLNFEAKKEDIISAFAEIDADPTLRAAFAEARDIYNQYNRNLLEFGVQSGAISRAIADQWISDKDYVPYYRVQDGVVTLNIGEQTPIRIGNLKDSPHLKELVGGKEAVFDFLTSSVMNTTMLIDMSMHNLAMKNLMNELREVGLAKISKETPKHRAPEGAVTFKVDGVDHFAIVDTKAVGVDSELLVKGLAGIPTMLPTFVRTMGVPSRILRRLVVASPVYMARQLVRDSTSAALSSGANMIPVIDALRQIGKPNILQSRGITGGQVFTGMPEDMTRILKDMQAGKISLSNGLAWLEAKSAQADALTRLAQYDSYIAQGMSEMEATMAALESMNFSRRGLSPGLHMVSTLIPFFNAQIQGLDVLYRAFTGQMPMNEKLGIQRKLIARGMLLFMSSMIYAAMMQDDEAYKNAKPEEKYGNWFVPIPGTDQKLRVPIPFELGYIFKALPEALVNIMSNEEGGEEALKALKHIVQQTVPGMSSYFMPQAVKPALEVLMGTSMYTGRSLESGREQQAEPGYRARESTTEIARWLGENTGFSPIKMEYLVRGYTTGLGVAFLQALSLPMSSAGPERAERRPSDLPVVGTLFQPSDASGIIDATYELMRDLEQKETTYKRLLEEGRNEQAQIYLQTEGNVVGLKRLAGRFQQEMGEITKYERQIRASTMSPQEKRQRLDEMRDAKIKLATAYREAGKRVQDSRSGMGGSYGGAGASASF